mgnify:FL=1
MQVGFQWGASDSYNCCYRQSCIDYIDSLPASMPWCEFIRILQAVVNQLEVTVSVSVKTERSGF